MVAASVSARGRSDGVVLCVNCGSSSVKVAVFEPGPDGALPVPLARGAVEGVGGDGGHVWVAGAAGERLVDAERQVGDHGAAFDELLAALTRIGLPPPGAAGHRLVHGGPDLVEPALVDADVLTTLRSLVPLAPLHLPSEIRGIELLAERLPGVPQVACFDTSFHRRMPEVAQRLPLPNWLWDRGVRRYGFHGLSYEYLVDVVGLGRPGRAVLAHLGNGASLAAVKDGQPVDTTMGLTPAGGLVMGSRPGDVDPGVLLYLGRELGMSVSDVDRLVNDESGMLGVSGSTGDVRELLARRASDPAAALALALFCRSVRMHVGALATELGGLDELVFTAGIGERAGPVRAEVCSGLAHLGVELDPAANEASRPVISKPGGAVTVRVVPTNEELVIARHTLRLCATPAVAGSAGP